EISTESALTPAWLIASFSSGIAKNARAASRESNVWVTIMSLGFSIERSTWWACTPCSAWVGAKPSYAVFQASKSVTRWRTRAMVLVIGAPFRSECLAAKTQASEEARSGGDARQSTPQQPRAAER